MSNVMTLTTIFATLTTIFVETTNRFAETTNRNYLLLLLDTFAPVLEEILPFWKFYSRLGLHYSRLGSNQFYQWAYRVFLFPSPFGECGGGCILILLSAYGNP